MNIASSHRKRGKMPTATKAGMEEAQIREFMDSWVEAVRAKDGDALLSKFASDVVAFDLVNPLKYSGRDALKRRLDQWLSSFDGFIGYEVQDLRVTASDDVAFCHSLNHVNATTTEGKK